MKIEIVQLENIRSHVKSTVPFAKGFNCLVGGLGCGKSSILYSIDFAFFGDPIGRSFEYLLREGASSGKVTVQFAQNGKSYTLTRGLVRRGKGINQDPDELRLLEGEETVSSGKNEAVAEQLEMITGFDRDLFREIVWVRQEHLKELLNAQPRERQKRLDELFGLSDYETAWSNLLGYQKAYEGERSAYEKDADVVGLEKLSRDYDRAAEEFSRLELDLQDLAKKLAVAQKTMEQADSRLKQLEETKAKNEELSRKEAKALADLANVQQSLTSATQKIEAKKSNLDSLNQRLNTIEAQKSSHRSELAKIGVLTDQSIESVRQYLATFDEQFASLKGEHEATLKNMQTDTKKISSLSAENRCPLCMQSLTDEYKNDLVQRIQQENNERRKSLSQLQHDMEELQQLKNKANKAFSSLQSLTPKAEELKNRIEDERNELAELSKELEEKQKFENEVHVQLDEVRAELTRFDVSDLDATKAESRRAFEEYSSLDSELRSGESSKKALAQRLDEVKERIDEAQKKIERMDKIVKAVEILGSIRDAYRSIQPKLRSEFVKILRNFAQQVLDGLVGGEGPIMNILIDEDYTPYVLSESGVEREVANLSGGERTLLAFAYRLGLGQLIMQSRTGHGLSMLLLDEPTESLGREDGSIDRLAEAISRFKAIEQIIAVTHSDAFAEKAEHVIRLEKEAGASKVTVER